MTITASQKELRIFRCEQQSEEWFAIKLGKVSASHFADVLNKKSGRRTYMFRLLGERLSGEPCASYSNKAMENGIETEPEARAYYEALYGDVEQVGFVQIGENVGCSPDALVGDNGGLEIKSPLPSTHIRYIIENKLPAVYVPQIQGSLWVTGRQWWEFVSFSPQVKNRPFWKIRAYRDEDYIKELSIAIDIFVEEMAELEAKITHKNLHF